MPTEWEIWIDVHISPVIAKWTKEFTNEEVKSAYVLSIQNLLDLEVYRKAKAKWQRYSHVKGPPTCLN